MKKMIVRAGSGILALVAASLVLLSVPTVRDVPDAITVQEKTAAGRHLLRIDDAHLDSMSQMLIVRAGRFRNPNEIAIDIVAAPFLWYTRRPIIRDFPVILDMDEYPPGHYDIVARIRGKYTRIASVNVGR